MYAVINDRGQQYGVREGDTILCDLNRAWEPGQEIQFDEVQLLSNEGGAQVGTPMVSGASVKAEVIGLEKGEKLVVFKFKRRKDSRTKNGHRQKYTAVRITQIQG